MHELILTSRKLTSTCRSISMSSIAPYSLEAEINVNIFNFLKRRGVLGYFKLKKKFITRSHPWRPESSDMPMDLNELTPRGRTASPRPTGSTYTTFHLWPLARACVNPRAVCFTGSNAPVLRSKLKSSHLTHFSRCAPWGRRAASRKEFLTGRVGEGRVHCPNNVSTNLPSMVDTSGSETGRGVCHVTATVCTGSSESLTHQH